MPKVYHARCQHCQEPFNNFSKSRLDVIVANHEMVCDSNPDKEFNREADRHGPDLKTALDRARKELGDW
jgi:hypothetical protein